MNVGVPLIIFSAIAGTFGLAALLIYLFIIRKPNKEFSAYRKNYWENMSFTLLILFFAVLILVGTFLGLMFGNVIGIIVIVIAVGGLIATPLLKGYLNAKRIDKIHQKEVDKIKKGQQK